MTERERDGDALVATTDGGDSTPSDPAPSTPSSAPAAAEAEPKSALWIVAIITSLACLGVYDVLLGREKNACIMTYMFEFPEYLPVKMGSEVTAAFPQYGLYVYGEGQFAERLGQGTFDGIPVLFVPGNSGSYKQVRSLASVALRKALEDDVKFDFHFDYFSVDFNEEFSALYGGHLEKQTRYLAHCVDRILQHYGDGGPKSVVLVGHSIGGLVAKSLLAETSFDVSKVNTLIALATPHSPVVVLDPYTRQFYDQLDQVWNRTRNTKLRDVAFVSLAGGMRDIQVRAGQTNSSSADISVATTHAPYVWVSTDHCCIVWCKQLVLALNRALFDSVDRDTKLIAKNAERVRDVFEYHLSERSTFGSRFAPREELFESNVVFDKNGFWSDHMKRQFVFERETVERDAHLNVMIFEDDPKHRFVTIDSVNLRNNDWVFGCRETLVHKNSRVCSEGINLSEHGRVIPGKRRRMVTFDMHELNKKFGFTHVAVLVPKGSEDVQVNIDVYSDVHRHLQVDLPRWITAFKSSPVLKATARGAIYYNLTLMEFDQPWQAYDIIVNPVGKCHDDTHFGLMRLITPWSQDTTQELIYHNKTSIIPVRLQTTKSANDNSTDKPYVQLILNPYCKFRIEVQASLPKMWGQMVRYYGPMVLPLSIAVLLVVLSQQLKMIETDKPNHHCPAFHEVLSTKVTPMSVVMPSRLVGYLVGLSAVASHLPITDLVRLTDANLDFGVLPIVLFFASMGLVFLVSAAAWIAVIVLGHAANKAVVKFLGNATGSPSSMVTEMAMEQVAKFPLILSGVLVALAFSTCGTVALCLGTFIYFVHLSNLYKDYLQGLLKEVVSGKRPEHLDALLSRIHLQFTLGLLWAYTALLNANSLAAWFRNLPFATQLSPDPSLAPAVALSASLMMTWGSGAGGAPRGLNFYDRISGVLQFLAILVVLYGSISTYRVNYFVSLAFTALSAQQLISSKREPEPEPEPEAGVEALEVEESSLSVDGENSDGNTDDEE